jgi:hypothetical protein
MKGNHSVSAVPVSISTQDLPPSKMECFDDRAIAGLRLLLEERAQLGEAKGEGGIGEFAFSNRVKSPSSKD